MQITQQPQQGWAKYPGNTLKCLSRPVMGKIQEFLSFGQKHRKRKVSGDISIEILVAGLIGADWSRYIDITGTNIRPYFGFLLGETIIVFAKFHSEAGEELQEQIE